MREVRLVRGVARARTRWQAASCWSDTCPSCKTGPATSRWTRSGARSRACASLSATRLLRIQLRAGGTRLLLHWRRVHLRVGEGTHENKDAQAGGPSQDRAEREHRILAHLMHGGEATGRAAVASR